MKAVVLRALGTPPRCEAFDEPEPRDGEAIVQVHAAALKPVDKQVAGGTHYASPRALPAICGTDGVGLLEDGQRVFFGGARAPSGAMAERTVVRRAFCFPVPEGLDDALAAAIPNPGVSAWLSLAHRAKLQAGEQVLILGATGVTGQLSVKIAKLLGASRVVAAGRNADVLAKLRAQGADATIQLGTPPEAMADALHHEAGELGFQVVIDYLWGRLAEMFFAAITRKEFAAIQTEMRFVQAGESAGPTIALPAAVLRSTAVTIMGTAGVPPLDVLADALKRVMAYAARGELRVETEPVPLAEIESVWTRDTPGRRLIVMP